MMDKLEMNEGMLVENIVAQYLATPYVIHTHDLKVDNGIVYIPLYMTGML